MSLRMLTFIDQVYLNSLKFLLWWTEAATRGVLWKKVFLEISHNLKENTCSLVSFLIKLQALLKKRLWHMRFPMNFAKLLKISLLQNSSGRLLLHEALQENVQEEVTFKKSSFSLFWFSLKWLVCSERNRTSCHQILLCFTKVLKMNTKFSTKGCTWICTPKT